MEYVNGTDLGRRRALSLSAKQKQNRKQAKKQAKWQSSVKKKICFLSLYSVSISLPSDLVYPGSFEASRDEGASPKSKHGAFSHRWRKLFVTVMLWMSFIGTAETSFLLALWDVRSQLTFVHNFALPKLFALHTNTFSTCCDAGISRKTELLFGGRSKWSSLNGSSNRLLAAPTALLGLHTKTKFNNLHAYVVSLCK